MGRVAISPSVALARLLRERRVELGLSLRDVAKRSREFGRPIPFSSLAKLESGRVDPGVRRVRVLFRIYDLAPRLLDDLLDLEEFSGEWPEVEQPSQIYEASVNHWRSGDLRKGLGHLFALRARTPTDDKERRDRQQALLAFAVLVGALGRYHLSKQLIEELLFESPDESLMVPILVQAASCWQSLGSPVASLAFLGQAEALLGPGPDRHRAWIAHLRANVFLGQMDLDAARLQIEEAARAYRGAADEYGFSRLFATRFKLALAGEDPAAAVKIAREGLDHATRHNFTRLTTMRRLEIGQALVDSNAGDEALHAFQEALASAVAARDETMQFYAQFHLWKSYANGGDAARAEFALQAAKHFVRHVDEKTPEADEIRQLASQGRKK